MKAMRLHTLLDLGAAGLEQDPLRFEEVPRPQPGPGEVLLQVQACGVCHTELDEIEGRTPPPRLPVIPGHEVIGRVVELGPGASRHKPGDRVGVGWIHCGCGGEHENIQPGFVATWVGETTAVPPEPPAAIIDTTPAWLPVLSALEVLRPGGRLVINAIRKEDADHRQLDRLSYHRHLWMEKEIKSVANVTAADIAGMLELAGTIALKPVTEVYHLEDANRALRELRSGGVRGAKVLVISEEE